jgi:DNA topoisomerase-3
VDARQVLDLKVGVAFSRFQTRFFQGRFSGLDSGVISYGPCQTPTLYFLVERHARIVAFTPSPFWALSVDIVSASDGAQVRLEWERGRLFDRDAAAAFETLVSGCKEAVCDEYSEKEARLQRPAPLNTVEMLKIGSRQLGLDPHTCMSAAERLYLQGYITYPRTETTAYADSFDVAGALREQVPHPDWGAYVSSLLRVGFRPRARR